MLQYAVGRAGHEVELHGVTMRALRSGGQDDEVHDAGVRGQPVGQALRQPGRADHPNVEHASPVPAPH